MEKTRVKLEIKKVGTFKKAHVKVAALDTGDPTSTLTSTKTTIGDFNFGHLRHL
ncbi:hypothetical protein [Pedobacter xixiisoli]|uniref:Uncharacterized protein n=1 Tax=Pedobacter xixiisoli TaxID=1476464 RepID=A0A286ADX6_9SPHI|nr:hypothetical protein [Pedobacter xixiisoli]SOD20100.1 hypothetical protein SAMN06297358_3812 [Pedobacter xixiisoli]